MAYGLKYQLLCTTRRSSQLYKLNISFDGYTGAQIDRNVPLSPFKLRKDRASTVRGTSFDFMIREEVDFEFLEFYTNSYKKIKVELIDPDDDVIWSGFNLPQQYSVDYVPSPVNVSFTAIDGLGNLKNEDFTLTGRATQLAIIKHCLDKTGLALDYSIAINTFEEHHTTDRTPLAQTWEEAGIHVGKTCYEVLERILNKYEAEITQLRNKWYITCTADRQSERMLYTTEGVYSGTEAAPAVLMLNYPGSGDVAPIGKLGLSLIPGAKQVTFTGEYGRRTSMLTNSDFTAGDTGWTKNGAFSSEVSSYADGKYLWISGWTYEANQYYYQQLVLKSALYQQFVFSWKVGAIGYNNYGGVYTPILLDVSVMVKYTMVGATLYLSKESGWVTDETLITMSVTSQIGGTPKLNKTEIYADAPSGDGTLEIRLIRIFGDNHGGVWQGAAFADIEAYFLTDGELYPSEFSLKADFVNSTEPGILSNVPIASADAPDLPNANLIYNNITFCDNENNVSTTLWHRLGDTNTFSLIKQLAEILASNNRIARQMLRGTIKGGVIPFDAIIEHAYNSNKQFEIAECEWDIYEETYNVVLIELLSYALQHIIFSDGDEIFETGNEVLITTDSIDTIDNGPTGGVINPHIYFTNSGPAGDYIIDWQLKDQYGNVIDSGGTEGYFAEGVNDVLITMSLPETAQEGLVVHAVINGAYDEGATSNAFSAVEITFNHFDTVPNQIPNTGFNSIYYEVTASDACTIRVYWQIRNTTNTVISSGSEVKIIASGTNTYQLMGTIPDFTGLTDCDIQAGRSSTNMEIESNGFAIND